MERPQMLELKLLVVHGPPKGCARRRLHCDTCNLLRRHVTGFFSTSTTAPP